MSEWTATEQALAAGALYGVYRDVESTHDFLKKGEEERNPLLGTNPTRGKVNAAGVLAGLGGLLAADALPDKYRAGFLGAWAGMEHTLATQNRDGKKRDTFAEVMKKPAITGLLTGLLAHYGLQRGEEELIAFALDGMNRPTITYQTKF